jgi:predicted PurR-regulated permease PerM
MKDDTRFNLFLVLLGTAALVLAFFAPSAFRFILFAFLLAYLVNPLVGVMERRWRVRRALSTGFILFLAFAVLVVVLELVVPYAAWQVEGFIDAAPDLARQGMERLQALGVIRGEAPLATFGDLLSLLREQLAGKEASAAQTLGGYLLAATSGVIGALIFLLNLFIIPVLFFFITEDLGGVRGGFLSLVPSSRRQGVQGYLAMVDRILGGFLRGQFIVALSLSAVYGLGLTLAGLRFGLVIGILTGLLSVIPYAGFALGIALAALVTLADFSGWGQIAGVTAAFAVGQALESFVLTPRIVGNKVGLTTLESLLAILVFAELGGFIGLLLAIPAGGVLKQTILLVFSPREV